MAQKNFLQTLEKQVLRALEEKEKKLDDEINKLDELKEDDIEKIREKRIRQLKEFHRKKQDLADKGHGTYCEVFSEKEFFKVAKEAKLLVVQFYRPATRRCEVVDKHLSDLAAKYIGTRFIKINAEKSLFLCTRLNIWMLPTIMLIKDGKTEHSILGFDELGGDNFETYDLEKILAKWGVIEGFKD